MLEYFMVAWGNEIITLITCSIVGMIAVYLKNLCAKHLNDETKKAVAKTVVQFVEQVYKDVHGKEKLRAAMKRASELMAEKGINVSAVEMETLIEAAVAEFNEVFKK